MLKVILLDFDGVVANVNIDKVIEESVPYLRYHKLSIMEVLDKYFYNNPKNEALDLGLTTTKVIREELRKKLWRGTKEDWMKWWTNVEGAYEISSGMLKWLKELQLNYLLAMVTDNHLGFNQWLDKRSDIRDFFRIVVNSANIGIKKPDIRLFKFIVNNLGVMFHECVFIDDDEKNVREANALGMPSIHFSSVEQARESLRDLIKNNAFSIKR